jgi:predicted small integral membrane protein
MFSWMVWTTPVAIFFTCIALMLIGMTVWEIKQPTTLRKGFLPLATTRGDRLFIGLLTAAYINLLSSASLPSSRIGSHWPTSPASGSASSSRWPCWR